MVSDYGYTTLAKLEKFAIEDYSEIHSALADAAVDAKISDAERYINGYIGTVFTGTIPADIELVTNMISKIMLDNWMIEKSIGRYADKSEPMKEILANFDIVSILEKYRDQYKQKQGAFISKYSHTSEKIYARRNPIGW